MKRRLLFILICVAQLATAAEIYRWVDKDGNVHFGDDPPPGVQATRVEIEEQPPGPPDEVELGRRRLLEQADIDAARRLEERRLAREAREAQAAVEGIEAQACLNARIEFVILNEQLPVYRDEQGKWRAAWEYDSYQGPRAYLDDAARPDAIRRARKNVEAHCENPDDANAQAYARMRWVFSERCAAARADLAAMRRPEARNPDSAIEAQEERVRMLCNQ